MQLFFAILTYFGVLTPQNNNLTMQEYNIIIQQNQPMIQHIQQNPAELERIKNFNTLTELQD